MKIGIVGAGIAGLTTYLALKKMGMQVQIFEQAPQLKEAGAGISIWPNATWVLKQLDLLDPCLALSEPIANLWVKNQNGKTLTQARTPQVETPGICIQRTDLLAVLTERVDAKDLFLGHRCTSIDENHRGISITFENGKSDEFDLLLGADGINSVVREYIQGPLPPHYCGYVVWRGLCHFRHEFYDAGNISETWGVGKRFGILPCGREMMYWYATANSPAFPGARNSDDEKSYLLHQFAGWHSPITQLIEATDPEKLLRNNAFDRSPRRGWAKGRALVVGDAAHPTTPNLGQGGCMALEDALILARILETEQRVPESFLKFEKKRFGRTSKITRTSRRIGELGQLESPFLVKARDFVSTILPDRILERRTAIIQEFRA